MTNKKIGGPRVGRAWAWLVCALFGLGTTVAAALEAPVDGFAGVTEKAIVYKTSGGKERRMHVFFPPEHDATKGRVPGMILFHGGGWTGGTPEQFRHACHYFAGRGMVCATVEYRMLGKAEVSKLPAGESKKRACVIDAKSAIRWFVAHADELGIDPTKIIAGGGSAGGHVSALATMNTGLADPTDPVKTDPKIAAYLWFNPAFTATDRSDPEIDILEHLSADLPPTIVFFGDGDATWKPGWDTAHAKWKSLGVKTIDLEMARGQEHGFFNKEPWRTVTLIAADEFFAKHGFLSGPPALTPPTSGEALVPSP